MKNLRYTLLISMAVLACEANLFNALPPETQEGKGTFGCKIDGEVWTPSIDRPFDGGPSANIVNDTSLGLNATGKGSQINIWVTGEITTHDYVLNNPDRPRGKYRNGQLEKNYFTDKNNTGQLIITKYDTINQIISGTFWFDAVSDDGEIAEIRDGRFDLIYKSN